MTLFAKSVSWSKFRAGLECPLQVQKIIDKERSFITRPTYHRFLGKLVQKAYEVWFNKGMNLMPKARDPEIVVRILKNILAQGWIEKEKTPLVFGADQTKEGLIAEAEAQIRSGYPVLEAAGLVRFPVKSEVKLHAVFDGFRIFGMLDFLVELEGYFLYDGKGTAQMDADENQLLYYGLGLHASGKPLRGGGFLYWKHGYQQVDLSPKRLKEFVEGPFAKGRAVFDQLKVGVERLPATPSPSVCNFCSYKNTCTESVYRKEPNNDFDTTEVGL